MRPPWIVAACLALGLAAPTALGTPRSSNVGEIRTSPAGRPKVVVDRVDLPKDVQSPWLVRQRLLPILRREGKRADWGAGRGSRVAFRFQLTELDLAEQGDVLRVRCTAVGQLPRGKRARGSITFSGEAAKRNELVERTLEIVARGVITRLAELERKRRGLLAGR
jgi:hypothetical protein